MSSLVGRRGLGRPGCGCGCGSCRRACSGRRGRATCPCGLLASVCGGGPLGGRRDGHRRDGRALRGPGPSPSPSACRSPCRAGGRRASGHRAWWCPGSGRRSGPVTCPSPSPSPSRGPSLCRGVRATSSGRGGVRVESTDRGRTLMYQRGASPCRLEAQYCLFLSCICQVQVARSVCFVRCSCLCRRSSSPQCVLCVLVAASAGGQVGLGWVGLGWVNGWRRWWTELSEVKAQGAAAELGFVAGRWGSARPPRVTSYPASAG